MAHRTSTIRGPGHDVSSSYVHSMKPTKTVDIRDNRLTDHSICVGFGPNAKRIKDRWEATKKQLRFENNYVALKWLLDSFVDDYLRSKNMEDTASLTRDTMHIKKERRVDEVTSTQSRRPASHSPSKTRFEDTATERKENGVLDRQLHSNASETRAHRSNIKENKPGDNSRMGSGDLHITGQYPYKYVPEYWSPYYHWHGNVPMNSRIVNVSSITGYSGYMMKTSSCSSLPTRDTHKLDGVLRTSESLKQLNRDGKDQRGESSRMSEKRPAVNLGFKTKSMPNLQCIPKESEVNSDEEEEIESDQESQGDLIALSSLSMPNLRKIPPDRVSLRSPPSHGHYEPAPLLRDRHDASSFSMPNLNAIQEHEHDENNTRKKTIRDFVMNRLTGTKDHEQGQLKTKIFNPNGYYPQSAMRDVIRERLLNRISKRKREENTAVTGSHYNGKMTSQVSSPLKFAKALPRVHESRLWHEKSYLQTPVRDARTLDKDDHENNNWKVPQAFGTSEQQTRNMWNRSPQKKANTNPGIWNPADVHVKRESSPTTKQDDTPSSAMPLVNEPAEEEDASRPSSVGTTSEERPVQRESDDGQDDERISGDEEEHVDVENVKDDEMEESGESESEPDEDASGDEKKNKRTRKTDKPRKRLKAM